MGRRQDRRLLRLSIGLEGATDLMAEPEAALTAARPTAHIRVSGVYGLMGKSASWAGRARYGLQISGCMVLPL